ncbi:hypothetical protein HWD72_13740 [Enterococcus hirae]|uniref:DUF3800 domain-containing protein n=1 Tax=Enterococcus hirae TaxID=1354 RepID=UPI0018196A85|nr:hypothetical protein [Enterococcus hirae]MBA5252559.1 hypothetical protein [Enterococcus hirae]
MGKFNFYYDESEHSRKINGKTILQNNFYDNFVTAIVGYNLDDLFEIEQRYLTFEKYYEDRKKGGELKSTTIKNSQIKYGFASMATDNVNFLRDFFSIFDDKIYLYYSIRSKIEYVILQLLLEKKNAPFFQDIVYSITKALVIYKPKEILGVLGENDAQLLLLLKSFFQDRITANKNNLVLKQHENQAFNFIISILDSLNPNVNINWQYEFSFLGFQKYLDDSSISKVDIFIDKEGNELTLNAAKNLGFINAKELDSENSIGIRLSDMIAGIISKLLKSLRKALTYQNETEYTKKKILDQKWFDLNEDQYKLYKKLFYILSHLNNVYYKSFSGIYADDFVILISFLGYIDSFSNYDDFVNCKDNKPEVLNSSTYSRLQDYYKSFD